VVLVAGLFYTQQQCHKNIVLIIQKVRLLVILDK
jgi:hypothetical protein